jgi:hypothetical protein
MRSDKPEKNAKKINKTVTKIFAKYPPKKGNKSVGPRLREFGKVLVHRLFVAVLMLLGMIAAFAQDPQEAAPLTVRQEPQETPAQSKAEAQKADTRATAGDLAKAAQNPVASLISVPVQNLTDFNVGPYQRVRNTVLQFQPVIPMQLGANWNLITRIIAPVISQPDIAQPHMGTFGLGDTNQSFFLSPAKPGKVIWGAGPTFLIPTATDDSLGTGKFSIGPTAVVLSQPGRWTLGILVNNLWSVAGPKARPDVNTMTLQYFVNYNMKKGYYIALAPIITANWNAPSGNVWLTPVGGGIGRIMRLGFQPVNVTVQAYANVKRPDNFPSPTWQLRFQLAFLYPKKPKGR